MAAASQVDLIRSSLERKVGRRVRLIARRGKRKLVIKKGVLESTYPCVFVVRLEGADGETGRCGRVSFSYTDILTRTVELAVIKPPVEKTG